MSVYCRNPRCKNYRKETPTQRVDLGFNHYNLSGVITATPQYDYECGVCGGSTQDEDEMWEDRISDLKKRLDDATEEQMEQIESILNGTAIVLSGPCCENGNFGDGHKCCKERGTHTAPLAYAKESK